MSDTVCFSDEFRQSIEKIVREIVKEGFGVERIGGYAKQPDPQDKPLEPGMILESTCKCDSSKKDYFVILSRPGDSVNLVIKCLTRRIGWTLSGEPEPRCNRFVRGANVKSLVRGNVVCEFRDYDYKIIHDPNEIKF